jgi:hypothetical protein
MARQSCAVCAWRENCAKRFSIPDGGARCPDFTRDVSVKDIPENDNKPNDEKEKPNK